MRCESPAAWRRLLAATGLLVALGAAAGTGVRATHGAQTTADEPQYLLTAISLASDLDLDIADELAGQRWRAFHEAPLPQQTEPLPGGRRLSPHGPLLPLLLAVPVALGGWVGAKLAMAGLAGLLAVALLWTAVRRWKVPPLPAAVVTGLLCLSPPLAVYGTQLYPELPAALAVVAVLAGIGARGWWRLAGVGLAVAALPWLAVKYAPVAGVLALLALAALWRAGDRARSLALLGGLVLAGAAFVAFHQAVYGGWTPYATGDHFVAGELTAVGYDPDYLGRSSRLLGLLVDRGFGLAAWQPAWLLAVPAAAALLRSRPAGWVRLGATAAAGWLVATFVALTMHGWWFPGRQVVVVLPCAVLALAWWAGADRRRLVLVAVLGAAGVLAYAWLVGEGLLGTRTWVVDFLATTNPLYRGWRALLPDYRVVTTLTWVLHGAWVAVMAVLAVLGWRAAGQERALPLRYRRILRQA